MISRLEEQISLSRCKYNVVLLEKRSIVGACLVGVVEEVGWRKGKWRFRLKKAEVEVGGGD